MSHEVESGIQFDFTAALELKKHDKATIVGGEGNVIWKGVDFRVALPGEWLWVEVKSWDPTRIPAPQRGGNQRSFVSKMNNETFGLELRSKFFGTTAFLAWTGRFIPSRVTYVVVLQPPRPLDKALLGTFMQRMASGFPRKNAWTHPLNTIVIDVDHWNLLYPTLPARVL